ncbi:MAG: glucosamine-6-phosphate deaminase [Bifidobacteriaceae bacterium]|jgi:6-phosphogluconolactonase/glucosamine-6-phosphate isomerase/deaminase|nr:glucosamine-6-phosphate deaminase [Bifidobacteriaceae bacterium]
MKIIIKDSYDELSDLTVSTLVGTMTQDKRVNLSLTAGATPALAYEKLVPFLKQNAHDLANTHYYNFDNIGDHEGGVTMQQLDAQLYVPAGITRENIHELTVHNYKTWDNKVANDGGLDLMLIGLGQDGHFCGNVPDFVDYEKYTYAVELAEMYEKTPELVAMFDGMPLPEYMVTMSLKSVLRVKRLVMIVNGKKKAHMVKQILGSLDKNVPSSFLQLHSNFTLILDKDAASEL